MFRIMRRFLVALSCALVASIFIGQSVNSTDVKMVAPVEQEVVATSVATNVVANTTTTSVVPATTSIATTTTTHVVVTTVPPVVTTTVPVVTTTIVRVPATITYVETDYDRWADENKNAICQPDEVCESIYVMPTLRELVIEYFGVEDWGWAIDIAFCESSGQPDDRWSEAVNKTTNASGWFQHLPKYWEERSAMAGFSGFHIMDPRGNVGVAAWLFYHGGGEKHWECAKHEHN